MGIVLVVKTLERDLTASSSSSFCSSSQGLSGSRSEFLFNGWTGYVSANIPNSILPSQKEHPQCQSSYPHLSFLISTSPLLVRQMTSPFMHVGEQISQTAILPSHNIITDILNKSFEWVK